MPLLRTAPPGRTTALLGAGPPLAVALLAGSGTAYADTATGTGTTGQTLTASKASGLSPGGEKLTVVGKGYDAEKGIYVAFCKDNGPGELPTPCGGGADTAGSLGGSRWISSNPPAYGKDLAVPYGPGGTFNVEITVTPQISGTVDCRKTACVLATRADHTRSADRSQDVRIPVTFASATSHTLALGITAAGALALAAIGTALYRRTRTRAASAGGPDGAATDGLAGAGCGAGSPGGDGDRRQVAP